MTSPVKIIRADRKTIRTEDLPPEAWQVVFGGEPTGELADYYAKVSWCFRGVDIRAKTIKSLPFIIENSRGKQIDNSKEYQNVVGFLPKPKAVFGLIEMALTVWGYGYLYKQPNILGTKTWGVRYLLPTDISPQWQKDAAGNVTGLAGFKRRKLDQVLTLDEIVYFWQDDPFIEFGPPNASPLKAAAAAAGVVLNLNRFAALFFERGAIKGTLLAMQGNPPQQEKERIKSLWGRIMKGLANAFGEMVINADSLKPIVVGEGLEALSDKNLSQEKRESIATALGIPHSILFSGAANYSVSQQDEVNLMTQTIIPDAEFIDEILNEQLFISAGYKIRHTPETLDIFQEDEAARSASMSQFMDALDKASSLEMAQALFMIFGMEIADEAMLLIENHFAAKEERAAEMSERLTQPPGQPPANPPPNGNGSQPPEEKRTDLDRWRTKALKAIKAGKAPAVAFESDEIPLALQGAIAGALEGAATAEQINHIFDDAWRGYP